MFVTQIFTLGRLPPPPIDAYGITIRNLGLNLMMKIIILFRPKFIDNNCIIIIILTL